jgi:hypothetical protein
MADSGEIIAARALVNDVVEKMNDLAAAAYSSMMGSLNALLSSVQALGITNVDIGIGGIEPQYNTLDKLEAPVEGAINGFVPSIYDMQGYVLGPHAETGAVLPKATPTYEVPEICYQMPQAWLALLDDGKFIDDRPASVIYATKEPTKALNLTLPTMPSLGTLPTVESVVPVIDVALLGAEFTYTEPSYTERVSPEVEEGIKRVLGGGMGLPQSYWEALWEEVAGDLARQQVGKLRAARNRGAASFWALPGETVLAASRVIQDEGSRAIIQARLEQAKQQAVFAREDFWQAIQQGIAYENMWVSFHQQVAARSLSAAEQLINSRVTVHNSNIARYNAQLAYAKMNNEVQVAELKAALDTYAAKLQAVTTELEKDKMAVMEYQALWSSFQISAEMQTKKFGETVKWWMQQIDLYNYFPKLKQEWNNNEVRRFEAALKNAEVVHQSIESYVKTLISIQEYKNKHKFANLGVDERYNNFILGRAQLLEKAQEAQAHINVAQAEWLQGMKAELAKSVAQLTSGFAQAATAAARVGLSSSVGYQSSDDYNTTASRNQEKVW